MEQRGSGSATFMRRHHPSWFYPGMNRCHCQSPPAWADGGSWRSGSPAARLPRPGMPDGVLDLYPLRSRTMLLQPGVPLHRNTGFESQHDCFGLRGVVLPRLRQNLVGQLLGGVIPFDVD